MNGALRARARAPRAFLGQRLGVRCAALFSAPRAPLPLPQPSTPARAHAGAAAAARTARIAVCARVRADIARAARTRSSMAPREVVLLGVGGAGARLTDAYLQARARSQARGGARVCARVISASSFLPHRIATCTRQVLCEEHALCARTGADASPDGASATGGDDDAAAAALRCAVAGRGVYFSERPCGRYSARAALADLDAAATHQQPAFARLRPGAWAACSGSSSGGNGGNGGNGGGSGGSGGVWARAALTDGAPIAAAAMDALRRLLEAADAPAAAHLLFAADGGTGGGLGASMLTRLEDDFPALLRCASVVAPSSSASTPSHPSFSFPFAAPPPTHAYNAALTLAALAASGAHTQLLHNGALAAALASSASSHNDTANEGVFEDAPGGLNALAAAALAGATACARLRWEAAGGGCCGSGGSGSRDLHSLTAALVPFPRLHLLAPALAPAAWHAAAAQRRRGRAAAAAADAGAPAEAAPAAAAAPSPASSSSSSPLPQQRSRARARAFPLEAALLAEALAPCARLSMCPSGAPCPGRALAAAVTLRGAFLSPAAAADAACAMALARPASGPPWGAAAAAAAAANATSLSFSPPLVSWRDDRCGGGGAAAAPPGGASACALVNSTAVAAALAAAAGAFWAPFRRRARVHVYTAEGMGEQDLADAAATVTGARAFFGFFGAAAFLVAASHAARLLRCFWCCFGRHLLITVMQSGRLSMRSLMWMRAAPLPLPRHHRTTPRRRRRALTRPEAGSPPRAKRTTAAAAAAVAAAKTWRSARRAPPAAAPAALRARASTPPPPLPPLPLRRRRRMRPRPARRAARRAWRTSTTRRRRRDRWVRCTLVTFACVWRCVVQLRALRAVCV
jgi:hypothetical protein